MPDVRKWQRERSSLLAGLALLWCAGACGDTGHAAHEPEHEPARAPASPPAATSAPKSAKKKLSPDEVISCSAIPATMVADVLGLPGLQEQSEKIEGKATMCEYAVPGAPQQFVTIRVERGYDPSRFEPSKSAFQSAIDVPGIGERAFRSEMPLITARMPFGIQTLTVLQNRTHLSISGPVNPEKIQFLAKEIAAWL